MLIKEALQRPRRLANFASLLHSENKFRQEWHRVMGVDMSIREKLRMNRRISLSTVYLTMDGIVLAPENAVVGAFCVIYIRGGLSSHS
mmetsp:Transcript_30168/g.62045  ORF Transcript_30168/g.62045 Transcript_30168/m.62045 type:complete len:88 (+) Transcript_30168:437-700(+)